MHARLHDGDAEPEAFRDLEIRPPLDVAQHQHRSVRGGQFVDRRGERRPQLGLKGRIVHARRPVGHGGDVATALIEGRQHLVQRKVVPAALPAAELLVGGVRHDTVEPGPECRLAAEGVDLSDHGPERVLHDLLRVLAVAGDAAGQAIRAVAVPGDETLRRHRLATPERFQKVEIAVRASPVSDAIRLAFDHHLKIHLASSLSSVNVWSRICRERYWARRDASTRRWSGWDPPYFGRGGGLPAEGWSRSGHL